MYCLCAELQWPCWSWIPDCLWMDDFLGHWQLHSYQETSIIHIVRRQTQNPAKHAKTQFFLFGWLGPHISVNRGREGLQRRPPFDVKNPKRQQVTRPDNFWRRSRLRLLGQNVHSDAPILAADHKQHPNHRHSRQPRISVSLRQFRTVCVKFLLTNVAQVLQLFFVYWHRGP